VTLSTSMFTLANIRDVMLDVWRGPETSLLLLFYVSVFCTTYSRVRYFVVHYKMKTSISTSSSSSSSKNSKSTLSSQDGQLHFSIEPLFDRPFPHVIDKGSLALRSERNIYGRGVFVSGW